MAVSIPWLYLAASAWTRTGGPHEHRQARHGRGCLKEASGAAPSGIYFKTTTSAPSGQRRSPRSHAPQPPPDQDVPDDALADSGGTTANAKVDAAAPAGQYVLAA